MKLAISDLHGISDYNQSRNSGEVKLPKENAIDYESRTWRSKCHSDKEGNCFIPACQFRNALSDAASFLSLQIVGKGKQTWTKHFAAGIVMLDEKAIDLGVKRDTEKMMAKVPFASSTHDTKGIMQGVWISVSPTGKPGPGPRVLRCFPVFSGWKGQVSFVILDDEITEDVFKHHITQAGMLIGIGAFRPRNRGWSGRFVVDKITWNNDYAGA